MRFELTTDPERFTARAGPFVAGRIERNLLATVTMNVLDGHHPNAQFGVGSGPDGQVAWAGLRVPSRAMVASELEPPLAPALVELWLADDPDLPGINGPPATARAIALALAMLR